MSVLVTAHNRACRYNKDLNSPKEVELYQHIELHMFRYAFVLFNTVDPFICPSVSIFLSLQ